MTEINETELLAEFWAEKLVSTRDEFIDIIDTRDKNWYFLDESTAPIIAHLIQEYMEGEGFSHAGHYFKDIGYDTKHYEKAYWNHSGNKNQGGCNNKNKWLANAEAARKALKGKK